MVGGPPQGSVFGYLPMDEASQSDRTPSSRRPATCRLVRGVDAAATGDVVGRRDRALLLRLADQLGSAPLLVENVHVPG